MTSKLPFILDVALLRAINVYEPIMVDRHIKRGSAANESRLIVNEVWTKLEKEYIYERIYL